MSDVLWRTGQSVVSPLVALWDSFIVALPNVIGGLIILAFGYLLGEVLEVIFIKGLKKLKFDEFIHNLKISKNLERIDLSHLFGLILKWYVFVIFLVPAASLARMGMLSVLLMDFARWVPNFILGVLILLFGWVAADVVCNKIDTTKIKSKHLLAMVTKAVILIFTIAIALEHIGINVEILKQTFLLLLSAAALGVGLAIGIGFGLGMKDDAKKILRNIGKKIK
jgi:hypothetical protein